MVSPRYLIRRQSAIMESTDLSISEEREETNMNITTVGLDLAKSVLHVACFNEHFKEVKKRMLRRNQVLQFFTQLPPLPGRHGSFVPAPITGDGNCAPWGMM